MKTSIKILTTLFIFLPLPLSAQDYSEQSLKTLFTSPQQRQAIDSARRNNESSENQALAGPSSVQVNGVVKRGNGESIVWVNGKNTLETTNVDGIKVYSKSINSNNKVPVMVDGKKVYIKPGETWSEDAGISDIGN